MNSNFDNYGFPRGTLFATRVTRKKTDFEALPDEHYTELNLKILHNQIEK